MKGNGKVVNGGHCTRIDGLDKFIKNLVAMDEVWQVRIGRIDYLGGASRQSKKVSTNRLKDGGGHSGSSRKYVSGGGFSFRVLGWAMIGERITGIRCVARNGTFIQQIILASRDLEALKARLSAEGYSGDW